MDLSILTKKMYHIKLLINSLTIIQEILNFKILKNVPSAPGLF